MGPAAVAFLELIGELVMSIKKEELVPLKSRCITALSAGLFRAPARRLLQGPQTHVEDRRARASH